MRKWKEPLFAAAFVLVAALLLGICSAALRPVHVDFGATWDPYLAEPDDSLDYLYLGSSYSYCDVNPGLVYDASGLTGYVLAGPEQTLSISYWYLKEALKTQSPKIVLIEGTALHFERWQNYSQTNLVYMPPSPNKLHAIFQAAEPELRTGLLFNLYFYHSRWKSVRPGEVLSALSPKTTDQLKGYTVVSSEPQDFSDGPYYREPKTEDLYQKNLADLGAILVLCREAGAQPVVVLHPTYSQLPQETRDRIRADLAALSPETLFFDWSEEYSSIGLDPAAHFYDSGHFNRAGAALFSAWLGRFLTDELGALPQTQTPENAAAWRSAADYWLEDQ